MWSAVPGPASNDHNAADAATHSRRSGSGSDDRARQWDGADSRSRRPFPTPRARTSSRTRQGRILYVGQGQEPAQPGDVVLRRRARRADPPDGGRRRHRRVDRGPQRGRGAVPRVQPHPEAPAPLQHPATTTTSRTPTSRSPSTRSGRGRWCCAAPSARACATSGPYAHAYAIRETLDLLLRTFPIRTCTKGKFDRYHRLGRPCLYAHIEKCAAPCVGCGHPRRRTTVSSTS